MIKLSKKATDVGKYCLDSAIIHVEKLQLKSPQILPRLTLEVQEESPSIRLYKRPAPLLSGIEQVMNLILTIGSYLIEPVRGQNRAPKSLF